MSAWAKLQMNWMTPKRPKLGINTVEYAESLERKEDHLYKIGDGEFGFPFGEYLLSKLFLCRTLLNERMIYSTVLNLPNS